MKGVEAIKAQSRQYAGTMMGRLAAHDAQFVAFNGLNLLQFLRRRKRSEDEARQQRIEEIHNAIERAQKAATERKDAEQRDRERRIAKKKQALDELSDAIEQRKASKVAEMAIVQAEEDERQKFRSEVGSLVMTNVNFIE